MERYTLLIYQDNSGEEILENLKSVIGRSSIISHQSFVAVVNLTLSDESSEFEVPGEKFGWNNYSELESDIKIIKVGKRISLAAAVNLLADDLPGIGQYYMDVLCCGDVFTKETPVEQFEISISLDRLEKWHNAHIVFHQPVDLKPDQLSTLEKWAFWHCGSVCSSMWPFSERKIWHGCIQMPQNQLYSGFELRLFSDSKQLLTDLETHNYFKKWLLSKEISHVATSLSILSQCERFMAPHYLLTSLKFLLQIPKGRQTFEASRCIIEYLESRPLLALVVSLEFTCFGVIQDVERYDSDAWIKAIQSGKIPEDYQQTSLPDDCPHFTFLLYYDASLCESQNNCLVAHLLMHPSDLDLTAVLPQLIEPVLPLESDKDSMNWDELIPRLDIDNCPEDNQPPKELTVPQKYVDPNDWPERRYLLLKELKTTKTSSILDGLTPPACHRKAIELKLSDFRNYFDKNGLPKKYHRKGRASKSPQILVGGQGKYPVNVNHTYEDITEASWLDLQSCQYHDIYLNHSLWKEEQESACNRLKEKFILEETLSSDPSCKKPRVLCVVPSNERGRNSKRQEESSQIMRRSKSAISHASYAKRQSSSPKKRVQKILGKSQQAQLKLNTMQIKGKPTTHCQPVKKHIDSSKIEDNVRRSPRFKLNQSLKSSTSNSKTSTASSRTSTASSKTSTAIPKTSTASSKTSSASSKTSSASSKTSTASSSSQRNADDLSERHKKKLREAVASALESEGITLNSPSFKMCGRRLFNVCKAFVKDILGKGNTSTLMRNIAVAHVKQVIEFEKIKS